MDIDLDIFYLGLDFDISLCLGHYLDLRDKNIKRQELEILKGSISRYPLNRTDLNFDLTFIYFVCLLIWPMQAFSTATVMRF